MINLQAGVGRTLRISGLSIRKVERLLRAKEAGHLGSGDAFF